MRLPAPVSHPGGNRSRRMGQPHGCAAAVRRSGVAAGERGPAADLHRRRRSRGAALPDGPMARMRQAAVHSGLVRRLLRLASGRKQCHGLLETCATMCQLFIYYDILGGVQYFACELADLHTLSTIEGIRKVLFATCGAMTLTRMMRLFVQDGRAVLALGIVCLVLRAASGAMFIFVLLPGAQGGVRRDVHICALSGSAAGEGRAGRRRTETVMDTER